MGRGARILKSWPPVGLASMVVSRARERAARLPVLRGLAPHRAIARVREAGLLFVHIPRNGGTSIAEAIYGGPLGHHSVRYFRAYIGPDEAIPSFAVVRDPVDRFLSGWRFIVQRGAGDIGLNSWWAWRTRTVRTVADLLDLAGSLGPDRLDFVLRSQAYFICDVEGEVALDRLFLLDGDPRLARFLAERGIGALSWRNRTEPAGPPLSPGEEAAIRSLYARDFAIVEQVRGQAQEGEGAVASG